MYDNKYLYFNNLLYTYNTIGYNNMTFYDIQIILITIIEALTLNFTMNLGQFIQYFLYDYKRELSHIIDNNVSSLKNLSTLSIQKNNLRVDELPRHIQNECVVKVWSKKDTKYRLIDYINFLHYRDKQIFVQHIFIKYNEYIENLPQKCDITHYDCSIEHLNTLQPTS
jgi:hypothetical protein